MVVPSISLTSDKLPTGRRKEHAASDPLDPSDHIFMAMASGMARPAKGPGDILGRQRFFPLHPSSTAAAEDEFQRPFFEGTNPTKKRF
jgi:hypothetical protein